MVRLKWFQSVLLSVLSIYDTVFIHIIDMIIYTRPKHPTTFIMESELCSLVNNMNLVQNLPAERKGTMTTPSCLKNKPSGRVND